jgi:hypothetical protein
MALSITGVTLVSALLAVAFGIIDYLVGSQAAAQGAQFASGAFDIAKIFAGAVVGSTGTTLDVTYDTRFGLSGRAPALRRRP